MSARVEVDELVLWCAVRYALGRATYVTRDLRVAIEANADRLSPHVAKGMAREISDAIEAGDAGWDCDVQEWERARGVLREQAGEARRGEARGERADEEER